MSHITALSIEGTGEICITDVVRACTDGLEFKLPQLTNDSVVSELKSNSITPEGRDELFEALHQPELTPEQRMNITTLYLAIGKIAELAHFRKQFEVIEENFDKPLSSPTFQPTLFDVA